MLAVSFDFAALDNCCYDEPCELALSDTESIASADDFVYQASTLHAPHGKGGLSETDVSGANATTPVTTTTSLDDNRFQKNSPASGQLRDNIGPVPAPDPAHKLNSADEQIGLISPAQTRFIILMRIYERLSYGKIAALLRREFGMAWMVGDLHQSTAVDCVEKWFVSSLLEPEKVEGPSGEAENDRKQEFVRLRACLERARQNGGELEGVSHRVAAEMWLWLRRARGE